MGFGTAPAVFFGALLAVSGATSVVFGAVPIVVFGAVPAVFCGTPVVLPVSLLNYGGRDIQIGDNSMSSEPGNSENK